MKNLEKISLITSEECIESNVLSVEATKFLEEETSVETLNTAATTNEQDGEDEDLVRKINFNFKFSIFSYLFKFDLI